ncbi:hypothetical protein, partial [Escherichia coli]|uniref:hypothetical protein n=1 Tax=Escherichia coli TaxID=562 RepID=UPI00195307E9
MSSIINGLWKSREPPGLGGNEKTQTTNLGVRGSNPFGRAIRFKHLANVLDGRMSASSSMLSTCYVKV